MIWQLVGCSVSIATNSKPAEPAAYSGSYRQATVIQRNISPLPRNAGTGFFILPKKRMPRMPEGKRGASHEKSRFLLAALRCIAARYDGSKEKRDVSNDLLNDP